MAEVVSGDSAESLKPVLVFRRPDGKTIRVAFQDTVGAAATQKGAGAQGKKQPKGEFTSDDVLSANAMALRATESVVDFPASAKLQSQVDDRRKDANDQNHSRGKQEALQRAALLIGALGAIGVANALTVLAKLPRGADSYKWHLTGLVSDVGDPAIVAEVNARVAAEASANRQAAAKPSIESVAQTGN